MNSIQQTELQISRLNRCFSKLLNKLGNINVGDKIQFPYGWRKAAKGRTVWRIVEEAISQNLEKYYSEFDLVEAKPSESEVSIYDAILKLNGDKTDIYINFKTSVHGGRTNKDDISKAVGLYNFYKEDINRQLFIVTFELKFLDEMDLDLSNFYVMPIAWLPDIYVNPSNNGNLQSSKYKDLAGSTPRTNKKFFAELVEEMRVAAQKRAAKRAARR